MEEIYANVDYVKPVGLRPSTNQTSRSGSDRRFLGAVVLLLGLLSFVLLAGLIGLGVHLKLVPDRLFTSSDSVSLFGFWLGDKRSGVLRFVSDRDSAAEHLAVRENLTERLQASENKTSSLSREIERLQTLSNRDRDSAAEHLAVRENLTERLQASENKTSSLSREIERLQTLSNRGSGGQGSRIMVEDIHRLAKRTVQLAALTEELEKTGTICRVMPPSRGSVKKMQTEQLFDGL
ncbi:hypothetical protein F2P81_021572 [Scophthalmus maximus]|uniref:Uncharacterized protein n=1 Tax=Scophthalmus maximus TaxID=52904 RepID=A0A6A4S3M2_SCOMX|nr:hypothetical protein F2P81_021572 [Scophthalmus maximus]